MPMQIRWRNSLRDWRQYVTWNLVDVILQLTFAQVKNAERPFTLILDDPLANSYIQNLYAPDPDPNMVIELYDRSFEQNEDLGLNDMKVEGYEEDQKPAGVQATSW